MTSNIALRIVIHGICMSGLGAHDKLIQFLTAQSTTQRLLWIHISYSAVRNTQGRTTSLQWQWGHKRYLSLCLWQRLNTHTHTHRYSDIYIHPYIPTNSYTATKRHICVYIQSLWSCIHQQLPSYLYGFADNRGLEPNHYITGLWATSQPNESVGCHDIGNNRQRCRSTEIRGQGKR